MDATRSHLSFPAEWITATIFLVATFAVGLLIVNELRVPTTAPAPAAVAPVEPTVPDDAVAVPKLMLGDGVQLSVGERAADAEGKLAAATLAGRTTEPGPLGMREIRSYEIAGTRFVVVLEPFERKGELRVANIYLR